jgi:hypothetical protein
MSASSSPNLFLSFLVDVYDRGSTFLIAADSLSTTSSFFSSAYTLPSSSSEDVTIDSIFAMAFKSLSVLPKFSFRVYWLLGTSTLL